MKRTKFWSVLALSILTVTLLCTTAFAADEIAYVPNMYESFWALVPPIIAILLALITKEVYSSLFLGILFGGLFWSNFSFEGTITHVFQDGMIASLSDSWNVGILVFLVFLGVIVNLMNKAGGSAAFGHWASKHFKSRIGVQLATIFLGVLIFIDDYFNCLTVGSVMLPVTDKAKISRAKLAYLIDATAAPVCIIAPISSWAAAVTGFVEGEDGLSIFLRAIPFNFYALLTLVMMIGLVVLRADFGPMRTAELAALRGNENAAVDKVEAIPEGKGNVIDLILPILVLISCCVIGMVYTGGFFDGVNFVTAFSASDASVGLVLGSFAGLFFTIVFYVIRRVISFQECMACLPEGFKAMVPAILILTLAWTLKSMTDSLGAAAYVADFMDSSAKGLANFLPAIIFVVACFLAFATGTSWGTFGILIPIVVDVFAQSDPNMMIISISACMAGAVCGDHCSPISDTTIMASAGAECNHVHHVSTQLPYVIIMAVISFICYLIAGFTRSAVLPLTVGVVLTLFILFLFRYKNGQTDASVA